MLFSDERIAQFINSAFEPVWESVRPVPTVRIDFGQGKAITRTLHGNIATYVCSADGQVLDILPGIYAPSAYLDRLSQFLLLANYVERADQPVNQPLLIAYHHRQAHDLKETGKPARLVAIRRADISKSSIERGVKTIIMPGQPPQGVISPGAGKVTTLGLPGFDGPEQLANWKALAEDTETNETVRRRQIHEWLAASGPVSPNAVKRWLYRVVLHADLDDPYLGLGQVLFANYPFKEDGSEINHP